MLRRWWWAWGGFLILWLLHAGALAAPLAPAAQPSQFAPLILRADDQVVSPWSWLKVRTGLVEGSTLEQAISGQPGWQPAPSPPGNLGPQRLPVALAFDVDVALGAHGDWVLAIDYPSLDRIDIEVRHPDGRRQAWMMGDSLPYQSRPLASRAYAVPLTLQAGQRYEVRALIQTTGSMIVPLRLLRAESFRAAEASELLLQGLLAGAMFCLLIYALAQWAVLRERVYAFYALNVAGTATFFFSYFGLGLQHLWGDIPWAAEKATMLAGLTGLIGAFLYINAVLELARRTPWLSRAMQALAAVLLTTLLLFATGWISYRQAHLVNVALSPAPLLMALPAALRSARAGDRVARYLLIGWTFYGACAACFALLQTGRLGTGFWTEHAFQFGTLAELGLWMLVLGIRAEQTRTAGELARRERDHLDALAHTDPLTGLMNRRGLEQAALPLLAASNASRVAAVYLIDLDGFKPINDQHGHDAGDAVLHALALRLKATLRASDLVARLGGDEFVVVADYLGSDADAHAVGHKLLASVQQPFEFQGRVLPLGMTVGYALAPHDGRLLIDLLKRADAAMYAGKLAGRGCLRRGAAGAGLAGSSAQSVPGQAMPPVMRA